MALIEIPVPAELFLLYEVLVNYLPETGTGLLIFVMAQERVRWRERLPSSSYANPVMALLLVTMVLLVTGLTSRLSVLDAVAGAFRALLLGAVIGVLIPDLLRILYLGLMTFYGRYAQWAVGLPREELEAASADIWYEAAHRTPILGMFQPATTVLLILSLFLGFKLYSSQQLGHREVTSTEEAHPDVALSPESPYLKSRPVQDLPAEPCTGYVEIVPPNHTIVIVDDKTLGPHVIKGDLPCGHHSVKLKRERSIVATMGIDVNQGARMLCMFDPARVQLLCSGR